MIGARRGSTAFLRNTRGNVLPLAAIGMLLSAALVGGGIDMSRAYRAKNRLQSACDAAALAGRRAVTTNGFQKNGPEEAQAINYFNTNFDQASFEAAHTTTSFTSSDNGQTIVGTASTTLPLTVMKIFGFGSFDLTVNCQASMGVGNSDVVMVLDTTGSMGTKLGRGTRISALRDAMKNFYTTVKTATQGTNARIRYGFVPYSSTVNVGRLLYALDPSYLRNTWTIQSRQAVPDGRPYTTDSDDDEGRTRTDGTAYGSRNACEADLGATPWTDDGDSSAPGTVSNRQNNGSGAQSWTVTTSRQPQQRTVYTECSRSGGDYYRRYYVETRNVETRQDWKWAYQPVTYDVSSYKAFSSVSTNTGNYGAAVSSTWNGCIEERGTTNASSFSYATTTGLTPSAATDLDIDTAPSDDNTRWAPMWPDVAYHRANSSGRSSNTTPSDYGYQASAYCPYQAQLLTEMSQSDFNAYADSLREEGSTYLDIGMIWGGRLSSPEGIFKANVTDAPANGGNVSRHIIFMTDGIMEPSNDILSAWGIEYHDRRVTSDGSSNDASRHTSRFLAVCEEIKAKGIRIWAISFTSGTSSDLQTCASDNSYFNADDADALNNAFQEIAKQVGELRLTQ
jgi:Flp pilus assembly protein TadG